MHSLNHEPSRSKGFVWLAALGGLVNAGRAEPHCLCDGLRYDLIAPRVQVELVDVN
jgi:hypothetical protein